MPLRTVTYDFDEEVDRIESDIAELEAVVDQAGDVSADNEAARSVLQELQALQTHLRGVKWARDEAYDAEWCGAWDEDVNTVTLGGLTGGEFGRMQDSLQGNGGGQGAARVYQVEAGTVEAPYVDDSMDENQRIATIADLPAPFLMWAEAQIDELSLLGNGQTNYDNLLEALQETGSA